MDHLPLLIQPALWSVLPALQYDMITLQPTREIIPGCGNQGILAREVLDQCLIRRLLGIYATFFRRFEPPFKVLDNSFLVRQLLLELVAVSK